MADKDAERIKDYGTKPSSLGIGSSVSLRAERSNPFPKPEIASSLSAPRNDSLVSFASLFITLGLLVVGWRQGRRLQQLIEQLKG